MTRPRRLRVALVKEELFVLTGNALSARILHQMLYWTERIKDVDALIKEEMERSRTAGSTPVDFPLSNGWIYKKADELKEEVLADESEATVRRRLQELVKAGWLHERTNPEHRWDKTLQYRLNFIKLVKDLHQIGYRLDGYTYSDELTNLQDESPNLHHADSTAHHAGAIPNTTTKTTTDTTSKTPAPQVGKKSKSVVPVKEKAVARSEKKEPTEEGRAAHAIVKRYADLTQDPLPNRGREVGTALAIVKLGYTADDVEGCYTWLMRQPFWQGQGVRLHNIRDRLSNWKKAMSANQTPAPPTDEEEQDYLERLAALNPGFNKDGMKVKASH